MGHSSVATTLDLYPEAAAGAGRAIAGAVANDDFDAGPVQAEWGSDGHQLTTMTPERAAAIGPTGVRRLQVDHETALDLARSRDPPPTAPPLRRLTTDRHCSSVGANLRTVAFRGRAELALRRVPHVKIFISWSGEQSNAIADAIRRWLPELFDHLELFMSSTDIRLGQRALEKIEESLGESRIGLIMVTPTNAGAPWINFEAGALSKVIDQPQSVISLLVGYKKKTDLAGPLAQFQLAILDQEGMREVVKVIASRLEIDEEKAGRRFDRYWPELKKALDAIPADEPSAGVDEEEHLSEEGGRGVEDKVDEALQLLRDMSRDRGRDTALGTRRHMAEGSAGAPREIGDIVAELADILDTWPEMIRHGPRNRLILKFDESTVSGGRARHFGTKLQQLVGWEYEVVVQSGQKQWRAPRVASGGDAENPRPADDATNAGISKAAQADLHWDMSDREAERY